ncbi:MAG: hypothetical protein V3W20_07550 [Candidatus Neomarinimicrobiota bacterium]
MKRVFKFSIFITLVFCIPLLLYTSKMSNTVYADTDQDSADFTISISQIITISGLQDIDITDPVSDVSVETSACVYTNIIEYDYRAKGLTQWGDVDDYKLYCDATGEYINYYVYWKDSILSYVQLTPPDTFPGDPPWTADSTSRTCDDVEGTNSTLNIRISAAAIEAVDAGNYSDTLTIEVAAVG